MYDPILVEHHYQSFVSDVKSNIPDGVLKITDDILEQYQISLDNDDYDDPVKPYCYFYVVENTDKITLVNNDFIVWIVPKVLDLQAVTFILVGLRDNPPTSTTSWSVFIRTKIT